MKFVHFSSGMKVVAQHEEVWRAIPDLVEANDGRVPSNGQVCHVLRAGIRDGSIPALELTGFVGVFSLFGPNHELMFIPCQSTTNHNESRNQR